MLLLTRMVYLALYVEHIQAITTAVVCQIFENYVHKHVTVCMYVQDTNTHEQVYRWSIGSEVAMTLLSSQELSVLGFRDPTAAQAYTWPYVSSGQDVVFVSPPLSGKTLTYLLPLLTTISAPTPRDSSEKYSGVCLLRCCMYHCNFMDNYSQPKCTL